MRKPKQKSTSSKSIPKYSKLQINSKEIQNNFEIPKNVAVHFGNYYGLNESSTEKKSQNPAKNRDPRFSAFSHNKTQFTRQMVYKLISSAGKQNYAKEVSTLLEETVEPANFKINLPPLENCIPNGKSEASYPLWYKDPAKLFLFSTSQGDGSFNEKYEKLGSYLSKYKRKNRLDYEKVLKKEKREKRENEEGLVSLKGESDSEEGSSRTQEKEARGSTSLSDSASSYSNLTSGWSSVTGKSATGSTSTMESESGSEGEDDDDSASSILSRSLTIADNESQGVNVPLIAH